MKTIPKLKDLFDDIISDIEAEFSITIPDSGKSVLRSLASVQAAKLKQYYLSLAVVQKNVFADLADSEEKGGTLERFGRVKLNRNPFPATAGEYTVKVTGTIGAVIQASTTFKSDDGSTNPGKIFILDVAFTLDGIDIITIRSLEPGIDAKLSINDTLTITAPVANVDSSSIVLSEVTAPVESELIEDYRNKVIDSYRLEPEGGAGTDYRLWASEVTGVQQSYPFTATTPNEVNLFIEATIPSSTDGKGTPSATILSDVEDAIEDPTVDRPSRKPLTVSKVNYTAITPLDIDIEIVNYIDSTPSTIALIENALKEELDGIRPFVGSIDVLSDKNDIFNVNKIISVILEAVPGSIFSSIVLKVDGNIVSTYTFLDGDIPYLNTVTYV